MADEMSREYKALLETRDHNIREEVMKMLQTISMPAALLFLYEFRLLYPHVSTDPQNLHSEYRKALRKKALDPLM